jgi:hypothetical protein
MLNQGDIDISLIPKEFGKRQEIKSSGGEEIVSTINRIAAGVVVFCLALSGGLYWYKNYRLTPELEKRNQDLDYAVKQLALKGNFNEIKKQDAFVQAATNLIKNHIYSSNLFHFIETHTHQDVRFQSVSFSVQDNLVIVNLPAKAKSVDAIAKQVVAFSHTLEDILRMKSAGRAGAEQPAGKKQRTDTAATAVNFSGYQYEANTGNYTFNLSMTLPIDYFHTNFSVVSPSQGDTSGQ